MRVRIDHGRDGQAFAYMLLEQLPGRADHLGRHQWIENNPAGLPPHERDVGKVKPANLIDAWDNLVETVIGG